MKRVCIVVLNWNGWTDTISCVHSLQKQSYSDFTLLVIDNGSTDGSMEHLKHALPSVEIISTGSNLGFGGGCNVGMQLAITGGAEFIWLINSDAFADTVALEALVRQAEQYPSVGAVGSVLYEANQTEKVQLWGGGRVRLWIGTSRHLLGPDRLDFISGASALFRTSALKEVGLFDEVSFFMYWEDTDLSYRLIAAGWQIDVAPDSKIWHRESSSLGKGNPILDLYFTRSGIRFLRKYAKYPHISVALLVARMLLKRSFLCDLIRIQAVIKGCIEA